MMSDNDEILAAIITGLLIFLILILIHIII